MFKNTGNARSRHNHRGFWNSRDRIARRGTYGRRLRCEMLEARTLLAVDAGPSVVSSTPNGAIAQSVPTVNLTFSELINRASISKWDVGIVNLSNPTVSSLGYYDFDGDTNYDSISKCVVVGDRLYAATSQGLQVVDVSTPSSPSSSNTRIYDTPGWCYGVAVVGNYAYVADYENGLQIIDLATTSTKPADYLVGHIALGGEARDVQVIGDFAYVATYQGGLKIVNVSNKAAPSAACSWSDVSNEASNLDIVGNRIYVADGASGLRVLEVDNILNPSVLSLLGTYDDYVLAPNAQDVTVVGNNAYVADGYGGLKIIDVSTPATPDAQYLHGLMGSCNLRDAPGVSSFAMGLTVIDHLALVAGGRGGLQMVNVSTPTSPNVIYPPVPAQEWPTSGWACNDVALSGGVLYMADDTGGVRVLQFGSEIASLTRLSDTSYQANLAVPVQGATYAVVVGPEITDLAGNRMDQDGDGWQANSGRDAYYSEFTVPNLNQAPTAVTLDHKVISLPENTSITTRMKVADIVVTDDPWGTEDISLSGADAALFEQEDLVLYLKTGSVLNYEANPVLDVIVSVDDTTAGSTPDATTTLAITLTDVNEAPTAVVLSNKATILAETTNTTSRIKMADIGVTDDALGTNALSLSGADATLFEIVDRVLYVQANKTLDFETNPILDVTVAVNDATVGSTPDATATFSITLTDVNEAPTSVGLTNKTTTMAETANTPSRIKVADIGVIDDALGTNTPSLSGADATLFEVVGTVLYVQADKALDYETNPVLDVTLSIDDPTVGGTPDATTTLSIALINVNEAPTAVTLSNRVTALAENVSTASRIKVADITVTDDALGTEDITLGGADAALFERDGMAVYLLSGIVLDYETNPVLDITVVVDDTTVGATPDAIALLSIAVTNVNEAPTMALTNKATTLAETASTPARIKVADIVVTDDALGVYSLGLVGADSSLFQILGAVLYVQANKTLDYETNPVLDVTVTVDDTTVGSTPDAIATLSITLTDVNEAPSVALGNKVTALAENTNITTRMKVADIVVSDDVLGSNVCGLAGVDAAMFEIVGSELYLEPNASLDFETYPALNVTVTVDDVTVGSTPDATTTLTISVADVNEAPTAVALKNAISSRPETRHGYYTSMSAVAEIVVTDDALGTNTLSVGGADAALFEISGNYLYVRAGADLDYETNSTLDVTVIVDDATVGSTPDLTTTFSMTLTDLNEAPSGVVLRNTVTTLPENANLGTHIKVADIDVTDDATGTNAIYLSGDDDYLFEVVGTGLYLKTNSVLDYESNLLLDVYVLARDLVVGHDEDAVAMLAINVTNVNEAPSLAISNNLALVFAENSNTATRMRVADIIVTDDALGTYSLTVGGVDASYFEIVGTSLYIKAGVSLDYEANHRLDVSILLDDPTVGFTPDAAISLTVNLTNVNEAPTVSLSNRTSALAENTTILARLKVADIIVTDDGLGTNTLGVGGADAALFEIAGTVLYLKAGTVLDFEADPQLEVTVTADDPDLGSTFDSSIANTIAITNVNEAPTAVNLSNTVTTLAENADTTTRRKMADIAVTDDAMGTNALSVGGADAALFEIAGTVLYLKAGAVLDYESNSSLDVTVAVDDAALGATPDASTALSIVLTDVNEAPTDIALSNGSVMENRLAGVEVGTFSSTDSDFSNTFTYSLVAGTGSGNNNSFTISGDSLKTAATFDYETQKSYSIRVRSADQNGLYTEKSFTITVVDVIDMSPASIGLYNPSTSTFFLRNTNTSGYADAAFGYGAANGGLVTLSGDWNGDGVDTIGLYKSSSSAFVLRDSNSGGYADMAFIYNPTNLRWIPIAGDWNGDGRDSIGLYNPARSVFYLRNANGSGSTDVTFSYGPGNNDWVPVAGDWDGDGTDTIGLYDPATSTFFLRNSNSGGYAEAAFSYGPGQRGWKPIAGDWNGNGVDTIGLYDPTASTFFLRNSNTSGYADLAFGYGPGNAGWMPVAGDWTNTGQPAAPSAPSQQFQDANVAAVASQVYVRDGYIGRNGAIQILASIGSSTSTGGTIITAGELADCQSIIVNAAAWGMPEYVKVLASDVVSGNPANQHYQGAILGNLAVGDTATKLNNLIDKWFKGTDRPTTTSNSYTYQMASGSLFVGDPSINDLNQGYLGDCYFISCLGSIANTNPNAIRNIFVDNGDNTWTVRFYYSPSGYSNGPYTADYVTVDKQLPTNGNSLIYANCGYTYAYPYARSYNDPANELWIALAEKAYAQWNETGRASRGNDRDGYNSYAAIEGGNGVVFTQVLGQSARPYLVGVDGTETVLKTAIDSNKAVMIGTKNFGTEWKDGLVSGHGYAVASYTGDTFTLYNPWGVNQNSTPMYIQVNWSTLVADCGVFATSSTAWNNYGWSSGGAAAFTWNSSTPASAETFPRLSGLSANGSQLPAMHPSAVDRVDLANIVEHELNNVARLLDLDVLASHHMRGTRAPAFC